MTELVATDDIITAGIFNFTGQAKVDTFAVDLASLLNEQRAYDEAMINKYRLSLEAIRKNVREFSFWQHQRRTGRPPVLERDLMIAFLVRQLFDATFRETEGLLTMLADYFELSYVPDRFGAVQEELEQALADTLEEVLLVRPGTTARTVGRRGDGRFRLQWPEAFLA